MLTLKEAASILGLKPSTLRRQAIKGRLRAKKFGRDWAVSAEEIVRYQKEHLGKPGQNLE